METMEEHAMHNGRSRRAEEGGSPKTLVSSEGLTIRKQGGYLFARIEDESEGEMARIVVREQEGRAVNDVAEAGESRLKYWHEPETGRWHFMHGETAKDEAEENWVTHYIVVKDGEVTRQKQGVSPANPHRFSTMVLLLGVGILMGFLLTWAGIMIGQAA